MQRTLTPALLLAAAMMLAADGYAQQPPATSKPAATTPAVPAATTPKAATTAKASVKNTAATEKYRALTPEDGLSCKFHQDLISSMTSASSGSLASARNHFDCVDKEGKERSIELRSVGSVGGKVEIKTKAFGTIYRGDEPGTLDKYEMTEGQIEKIRAFLGIKAPAATTPKSPVKTASTLPSKELLIEDVKDGEFKGTISVTADDADCRSVKFNIDASYTGSAGLPMDSFAVFYPGITFSFTGHSCIPAKGTQFNAQNDVNVKPGPGGGMSLDHNRVVSTGPVIASGSVSMAIPQGAAVADFTATQADPLVFQLTKNGYQYISGTGTVKLPSGKVYTWTTSGENAAMTQTAPAATTPKATAAATAKTPLTKTGAAVKDAAAAPPSFTTRTDKFSYALGMNIGSNLGNSLKNQSVEVDWNLVSQGLKDSTSGGKTRLTEDEAKAVLTEVQNEVNKQRQEKMQQAAAANKTEGEAFLAANKSKEGVVALPSGLQYKILTAGAGPKPTATDSVECNYRGTLVNGTEFDSSYKRGKPVTFPVSGVIKGWTEALQLMTVGSKWQLFIPSSLAYAERGAGAEIGPNATLIFEVELLSIVSKNADNAPSESSQKKTYTLNSSSVFRGPNGEMLVPVEGQMLLDKGLLLTGGKVGEVGSNSIQIAGHTFQVVEATKICGADGKRAKLSSFKLGDNAAVTSALDEKDALTLRNGLAFLGTGTDKSQKPQKYECE